MRRIASRKSRRGYVAIAMVTLILFVFLALSTSMFLIVDAGVERTKTHADTTNALVIAQNRVEKAKTYIMGASDILDTNDDGIINGEDDVAGNWVTVEDDATGKLVIYGNIHTYDSQPGLQEHFIIRASGIHNGTYRAIEAKLGYVSFLKFARFVEQGLNYGEGALLTGMVYSDGNINVPSGSGGPHVIFKRDVITTGVITPKGDEIVEDHEWDNVRVDGVLEENSSRSYTTNVPAQFAYFRNAAQSQWGIYIDDTVAAKLEDGNPQLSGSSSHNLIDLTKFKNLGTASAFYDADDNGVFDALYDIDVPNDFNGVVYWNASGSVHVRGNLTGQSLSIFTGGSIYVDGNITSGSDADGYPVNLGLCATNYLYWSYQIPSVFEVNAAVFVSNGGYGVEDHDNSPYDDDNSHGWQSESNSPPFYFKVYGPLVTQSGGDNGAWVRYGAYHPGVSTREWVYDVDITTFPPPFPVVEGLLVTLSHRETETRF